MKTAPLLLPVLLALAAVSLAQEKATPGAARSDRKTMIFQPGAKAPDGTPAAATAAPAAPASTETKLPNGKPDTIVAAFFAQLQAGKVDDAYAALTRGSRIAERPEEMKTLKGKTNEAIEVFGPVIGFEMVEMRDVGQHLTRHTYLSLNKEFPLRWRFYFYQAQGVWRLVDLRVDDRLSGIFDEPDEARTPEPRVP